MTRVGTLLFTLCIFILFMLYLDQDALIYHCGWTEQNLPPSVFGLPAPEVTHNGTLIKFQRPTSDRVIYYFHGNGMCVPNEYWRIGQLYAMCNCSVWAVEYPQCMDPSPISLMTAWLGRWERYQRIFMGELLYSSLQEGKQHYLLGASLGSAYVMSAYPYNWALFPCKAIKGVILENAFTSVPAPSWIKPFLFTRWDNPAAVSWVQCPVSVLFLTSEADEIIPPSMSAELYEAWGSGTTLRQLPAPAHARSELYNTSWGPATKTQVVLSGALHGHAASHPDYLPAIAAFLRQQQ